MITFKLLQHTQEKVKKFFIGFSDESHGLGHIGRVVSYSREICRIEGRKSDVAEMAAWLHDIGRVPERKSNPRGLTHHELSYELALDWFEKDKHFSVLDTAEKEEILYAARYHWDDTADDFKTAVILRDADKLDLYGEAGLRRLFVFHQDAHELAAAVVTALERASRLRTSAAKKILSSRQMLAPIESYLKSFSKEKRRVLCAISGGVDSAVSAAILQKAGYEVTGAFMKCYSGFTPGSDTPCWIEDRREALRVAAKLGIKMIDLNFEKEYQRDVVDYLYKEYRAGRTPNPDVMCNKYVKIPLLLKAADRLGFDFIATGHYARLWRAKEGVKLLRAADKNKDQTYFLHQLKQKELSRLIFPVGILHKDEVRIFAKQWKLPVAEREESMGICFVGEVPMKGFLQKKIKPRRGAIILDGEKIGEHDGLAFYTIGERVAVKNGGRQPLFVAGKDAKHNYLIVGRKDDLSLFKKKIQVRGVNWITGHLPKFPLKCEVRLRHRQPLQEAVISGSKSRVAVEFKEPQRAVTSGQFAVFYKKDECLGGGEIN